MADANDFDTTVDKLDEQLAAFRKSFIDNLEKGDESQPPTLDEQLAKLTKDVAELKAAAKPKKQEDEEDNKPDFLKDKAKKEAAEAEEKKKAEAAKAGHEDEDEKAKAKKAEDEKKDADEKSKTEKSASKPWPRDMACTEFRKGEVKKTDPLTDWGRDPDEVRGA